MSYVSVMLPPPIGSALDVLLRHARRPCSVAESAVLPAVVRLEQWQRTGYVLNDDELDGATMGDDPESLKADRRHLIKERNRLQDEQSENQRRLNDAIRQLRAIKDSGYMPPDWWEPREWWMKEETTDAP